jgi:serine/threonine protein kinase
MEIKGIIIHHLDGEKDTIIKLDRETESRIMQYENYLHEQNRIIVNPITDADIDILRRMIKYSNIVYRPSCNYP